MTDSEEIRTMTVKEFRELGYLQELNRQFLHPLGLALAVHLEEDGTETLADIWDYRHDSEGLRFDTFNAKDVQKAQYVMQQQTERRMARFKALGYIIQPLPDSEGVAL